MTSPAETFRLADQTYDPAIRVDAISEHPENYNQGDVGAISQSIDANGFYGAIGVQRSSGFILWGNHRYRTAVLKGAAEIPGFWLDVDDDQARRLLAVDNRTAALATVDEARLVTLLTRAAATATGLAGTGYDGDDLDDLIKRVQGTGPPAGFREYDDDLPVEHKCPACGYEWSGQPAPGKPAR